MVFAHASSAGARSFMVTAFLGSDRETPAQPKHFCCVLRTGNRLQELAPLKLLCHLETASLNLTASA